MMCLSRIYTGESRIQCTGSYQPPWRGNRNEKRCLGISQSWNNGFWSCDTHNCRSGCVWGDKLDSSHSTMMRNLGYALSKASSHPVYILTCAGQTSTSGLLLFFNGCNTVLLHNTKHILGSAGKKFLNVMTAAFLHFDCIIHIPCCSTVMAEP